MSLDDDPEVLAVMRSVALYLQRNPLASDTAEGIRRWWLGDSDVSAAAVQRALDALAHADLLREHTAADGHRRYRLDGNSEALQRLMQALGGSNGSTGTH